jgi:hypothetical protein
MAMQQRGAGVLHQVAECRIARLSFAEIAGRIFALAGGCK